MLNTSPTLSEKRIQIIVWTLLSANPIVGMAVDLIAPSLPAIASSLHIADETAKNVISTYLLGYALGNFFTGILTDSIGRQKLIRVALLGFIAVSLMPLFFPHIALLLTVRFLQGITLGAVAVLVRTIFSDLLTPEKLIRIGPLMGALWGLGPVLGPVIGGYLQHYFNWQAGFLFFALITSFVAIVVFLVVPETHFNRQPLKLPTIKKNLLEVLTHRVFMALVLLMGLVYSMLITFNTAAPFFIQKQLHYSPIFFGHLALCLGLMFLLSTFVCRYLLKIFSVERLYFTIINLFIFITMAGVVASYFFSQSIVLVTLVSLFMFFATGFIFPLSIGKGMSLFRHVSGTASATMYLFNVLITSLTAFVVSFVNVQSSIPLMWMYFLLMLLCVIVYWVMLRRKD